MKKYFEKLRLNCLNNQVQFRYHNVKLKRKVLDALKINFSFYVQRESTVLEFIYKREIGKYFMAIKHHNTQEKQKV